MSAIQATHSAGVRTLAMPTGLEAGGHWQTFVWPRQYTGTVDGAGIDAPAGYLRFDLPNARKVPFLALDWSAEVGFHQKLSDSVRTIAPRSKPPMVIREPTTGLTTEPTTVQLEAVQLEAVRLEAVRLEPETQTRSASAEPDSLEQQPRSPVDRGLAEMEASLSSLLAEAAHDIRSPIATASQILNTVTSRVRTRRVMGREELELLDVANMRLVQASNWAEGILLDQSLERGRPVVVRSRFYPHQWQGLVKPLLNSIAQQRRVRLAWVGWDRSMPPLYLDVNHLSRAVVNLVSNAVQASCPGDVVSIRVDWQQNVSQRLIVAIEDTGCGLAPELLREFNATSSQPTQRPATNTTGLGLRTAKALIVGTGGQVSARHANTGGTLFRLTLPVDDTASLTRSWLLHNFAISDDRAKNESVCIEIHAIRQQGLDPQYTDSKIQQAAGVRDLVYRVAKDRWLWFAIVSGTTRADRSALGPASLQRVSRHLNAVAGIEENACRTKCVFQTCELTLQSFDSGMDSGRHLGRVTSEIAARASELIGDKVPPVDDLLHHKTIAERPLTRRGSFVRADQAAPFRPHFRSGPKTTQVVEPDENLPQALSELAHHWHRTQAQLEKSGASLLSVSGGRKSLD